MLLSIVQFSTLLFHCTVAHALLITFWRLGAAAASTAVYAGDKRSSLHCLFCGVTAAVAPNRQLSAGIIFLSL